MWLGGGGAGSRCTQPHGWGWGWGSKVLGLGLLLATPPSGQRVGGRGDRKKGEAGVQGEEGVTVGAGQQTGSWEGAGFHMAGVEVVGGAEDPGTPLRSLWEWG